MGITLPKPVMTKVFERYGNDNYRAGSACVNGFRESMEDAHIAWMDDKTAFFGVFDGHVNDKCSEFLERAWSSKLPEEKFPMTDSRMQELALSIDEEWLNGGQDGGSTGTFFTAMRTAGTVHLQVGNVGDSRVILCKNGECIPMTNDHKPMNEGEHRRIMDCGGRVENGRVDGSLAVSRAFGDRDYKQNTGGGGLQQKVIALADITHGDACFGPTSVDFAVLCCDGVFESNFSNEEVITFIKAQLINSNDLAFVSGKVCDEAVLRGSRDNISCMIVQFQNGSDYGNLANHIELVPGPFSAPRNASFRKMYQIMAKKGGADIPKVLELRYNEIRAIENPSADIVEELEHFRPGPPADANPEQRTNWFQELWDELNKDRENQSREQLQRFQMLQQQVGVPLPMLLSLMTGEQETGNAN